jgi:hypothetical protein
LKIDALNVPPAKSYATPARSRAAAARLIAPPGKTAAKAAPSSRTAGGEERRRGQRVLLRVRASIHVALQGKTATFDVATLSVNPCGALVVMQQSLPAETRLVLEHMGTKERIACKVARAPKEMREGFHVPLEFDSPAPDFWKIAFPPADWCPDDL